MVLTLKAINTGDMEQDMATAMAMVTGIQTPVIITIKKTKPIFSEKPLISQLYLFKNWKSQKHLLRVS